MSKESIVKEFDGGFVIKNSGGSHITVDAVNGTHITVDIAGLGLGERLDYGILVTSNGTVKDGDLE